MTAGFGIRLGGKASTSRIVLNDEINVKISGPTEVMVKIARNTYTTMCHQLKCRSGRISLATSTGRIAACACTSVGACAMSLLLYRLLLELGSIKRRWMSVTTRITQKRITDIAAALPKLLFWKASL